MGRTGFVEHKGKQIVYLDFTGFTDAEQAIAAVDEARAFFAAQPRQQTLRTLTNVKDSHFDTTVVKALRELVEHNKPYVKAGAVVGLSGLMRVVYTTLLHLTGRNLRAFDTVEEAKDFLATQ
jgi:glyoxylate carboligase